MNNPSRSIIKTILGAAALLIALYGCTFNQASGVTKQQAPIADSQPVIGIDNPKEMPKPAAPVTQANLQQQQKRVTQVFSNPKAPAGKPDKILVAKNLQASMKTHGYSDVQIAALLGNIEQESKLNPFARSHDGAFGLMQWLGARAKKLKTFEFAFFAKNLHLDPRTYDGQIQAQVAFIAHEATGSHAPQYSGLKKMTSLRGATLYVRRKIEVAHEAHARDDVRISAAREYLTTLQNI